jgi:hypothetical protein
VLSFAISEIFKIKKRPPSNLRKGTWHRALGTIFIIITSFSVADKLFIVDFRPFLFFEKFRKNPNKKAAFGVSAPKTAGGNIQFSAVLFPPSILAQKVLERKLLWDFYGTFLFFRDWRD